MRRHPGRLPTAARLWPGLSAAAAPLLRPPAPGLVARSSELGPGAALSAGPRLRARREGDPPSRRGTAAPSPLAHAARRGALCLCSREFCSEKSPRVWAKNRAEPRGQPRQNGRNALTPGPGPGGGPRELWSHSWAPHRSAGQGLGEHSAAELLCQPSLQMDILWKAYYTSTFLQSNSLGQYTL